MLGIHINNELLNDKRTKTEIIYDWLLSGYTVYSVNKYFHDSGTIYMHDKYFRYNHSGSSAIKATKKDLDWLIKIIFNDIDFYIITPDKHIISTNFDINNMNHQIYDFDFYDVDTDKKILSYSAYLNDMLIGNKKEELIKEYNKKYNDNIVRVKMIRRIDTFTYFSDIRFAI